MRRFLVFGGRTATIISGGACNALAALGNPFIAALMVTDRIRLVQGDITQVRADALVTAANEGLRGGGGVDGAIHAAAGPNLVAASMAQAPCPAGSARITDAFDLPSRYVIHAVGPIFSSLESHGPVLAATYESSLALAAHHQADSVAFPCISTGVYGFPQDAACEIAIATVFSWIKENDKPQIVIFCCFDAVNFARYQKRLRDLDIIT